MAFLKYGYNSFGFKVLEEVYLDPNWSDSQKLKELLSREDHFADLIKPEYNIRKKASSNLGIKLSKLTRARMSNAKLGKPGNKTGSKLSIEFRALFRNNSGKSVKIEMLNENEEVLSVFNSIQIASEVTGIHRNRISRCAPNGREVLESILLKRVSFINLDINNTFKNYINHFIIFTYFFLPILRQ